MKISTLTIEMAANVARLRQDMDRAQKTVDSAMGGIRQAVKAAGGVLAALGAGLSVGAFAGWIRGAIQAADEMTKLAQKTGMAVSEVAGVQLAFRQSGVEATQFVPIMAKLSAAAVNGSDALAAMGVEANNADGSLKSTRQLLGEVAERFAGYEDGAAKTALAVRLFGEEGAKLLPLLNQGAAGLAAYDETARRLGLTIDKETGRSAERFNDTIDLLGQGTQGVARMIAAQMLPTLEGLAGQFLRSMTEGDRLRWVADFLSTALKGLVVVALGVAEVFDTVGTSFGGLAAAAVAAARGEFREAYNILKDIRTDIGTGWKTTLDEMSAAWSAAGDAGVAALTATSRAAGEAAPRVQQVAQAAKAAADEYARWMESMASSEDKARWESFQKRLEAQEAEELAHSDWLKSMAVAEEDWRWGLYMRRLDEQQKAEEAVEAAKLKRLQDQQREWQKGIDQISQSVTDALISGGLDARDLLRNIFKTLVLQPLISPIISAGSNMIGGFFQSLLPSFDGGGYTGGGARSGGLDGRGGYLAMLHPRETVIDHTKGGGGGGGVSIVINNTIGDVATQSQVVAGMQVVRSQIMGELQRSARYGGAMAA